VQNSRALTGPLNTRDICTRTTDEALSDVKFSAPLLAEFESNALAFGCRPDAAGKDGFPADVCRLTGSQAVSAWEIPHFRESLFPGPLNARGTFPGMPPFPCINILIKFKEL
jgi:hypothetical protein